MKAENLNRIHPRILRRAQDALFFVSAFCGALLCLQLLAVYLTPFSRAGEEGEALLFLLIIVSILAWAVQIIVALAVMQPLLRRLHGSDPGAAVGIFVAMCYLVAVVCRGAPTWLPTMDIPIIGTQQLPLLLIWLTCSLAIVLFSLSIAAICNRTPGVLLITVGGAVIPAMVAIVLHYVWSIPLVASIPLGMIASYTCGATCIIINLLQYIGKQANIMEHIHQGNTNLSNSASLCKQQLKASHKALKAALITKQ